MADSTGAPNQLNDHEAGDGVQEPQERPADPIPSSAGNAASALKSLLAHVGHEVSPHPVPELGAWGAGANPGHPSSPQIGSPAHATFRDLEAFLRASTSPEARSPHTPRSPYSAKPSMVPSSPDAAAAAQLQWRLRNSLSSASLEHIFRNKPLLPHSLSCSSFPLAATSQLPSASPEPFAPMPAPPFAAFRQQRLPSPLSAAAEAPAQWISAAPTQQPQPATSLQPSAPPCIPSRPPPTSSLRFVPAKAGPVTPQTASQRAGADDNTNRTVKATWQADKRARPDSQPEDSDTVVQHSQTISADEWVPGRTRRSSRTGVQKATAAAPSRPGGRTTRSGRASVPVLPTPGGRRTVPAAIRRLLAPHGNRGVTPYRSVSLMVRTGRYDVTPHHFKRQIYLGSYETAEQAGRIADLAEVAAGKPGMRLNFDGVYGAEMERVAEMAAQPGMTPDKLKAWVVQTHEHIKTINRKGRPGMESDELESVPSILQTHISQMVQQDSVSLGYYLSKDRAASAYDQVLVQALGLKAQTNFSISNYKHLLSEVARDQVDKAEEQLQIRDF